MSTSISPISTSSFVTEVLATAGELCREDVNSKLSRLSRRVEEVKVEVYDGLQRKYQDFYPCLDATLALSSRVALLSGEMDAQAKKIELEIKMQLDSSTSKFQELSSQLEESKVISAFLERLVLINDALQSIDLHLSKSDFLGASESLVTVQELMEQPLVGEGEIKVFATLQEQYSRQSGKVRSEICEAWRNNIKWVLPKRGEERKNWKVELHITTDKDNAVLENLVQAMYNIGLLDEELQMFSDRCLKYIVRPVIHHTCTMVKDEASAKAFKLGILTRDGKKEAVSPTEVFQKLLFVFEKLECNLLGVVIKEKSAANEAEEPEGRRSVQLITKLGNVIAGELLSVIIQDCLAPSVPSSNKELKEYDNTITVTDAFQKNMQKINLISETNKQLTDFVGSVNVLFANKKCEEILQRARVLMTSEIHNMIPISDEAPFGEDALPSGDSEDKTKRDKTLENAALQCEKKLSAHTFQFPKCQISVYVKELIQLVYETLQEATSSSPQCAIQLFYCVRNIFELFFDVVPTYHKEILQQLPQITALHHNNCMYIAHHLLTMGHQYSQNLPEPLCQGAATFVDLVPEMRRQGTESFLQQMRHQRTEMVNCLAAGANGFQNISTDGNFMSAERAVKQCLHQLKHLSAVWRDVLPQNVFNKSIGTLLNSLVVEIANSVVSLEDISADDATQLYTLMSVVKSKAPEVFQVESGEEDGDAELQVLLQQSVMKWKKFLELMFMMNASLHDILDRWTDGKGPLAHHLSSNEVKQLIRALFQNTERRSQTLAKIK